MAVCSCVMALFFVANIPFVSGVFWHGPTTAAIILMLAQGIAFIGALCLGILAVIRMNYVDKSLRGLPYAIVGITIPALYFIATAGFLWRSMRH